jgi:hypothetical protein
MRYESGESGVRPGSVPGPSQVRPGSVPEDTARVIGLALAFFGGLAVLGWVTGVFGRLGAGTVGALGLFALGFAVLTYALDRGVRGAVNGVLRIRSAPGRSPAGRPGAPSARRTSVRGGVAAPARGAD